MGEEQPQGTFIEIIERRTGEPDGSFSDEVVVPYEVRLNGQLLAMPSGYPVKVHEIDIDGGHLVLATLTLVVKRLVVGAEWPEVEAEMRPVRDTVEQTEAA